MTDYLGINTGANSYPLTAATTNSPLKDIDPSIYYALDFLAAILQTHLGARWSAEAAKTSLKGVDGKPMGGIVGSKVGYDPREYLTHEQLRFPLLALYRGREQFSERTIAFTSNACALTLMYVLPPLTPSQAERIIPFIKGAVDVMFNKLEQGWDPLYTPPGGTLGQKWSAKAGIDKVGLQDGSHIGLTTGGNLYFPSWYGTLNILESSHPVPSDFQNFTGGDIHLDLKDDPTNTTIPDFVVLATDVG